MSKDTSSFVTTLDKDQGEKLRSYFEERDFVLSSPPHTHFSAKGKNFTCTLYTSLKLVVQGKGSKDFIEFYLEPEILNHFHLSHPLELSHHESHIGVDESGKGDLFGPLCIAAVFVRKEQFQHLQKCGIKDSKALSDPLVIKLAALIKKECLYHIVKINPLKYNQIYSEFKNLNTLLAWGHATAIEAIVAESGCTEVIVDQFADERVVERALKRKKLEIHLTQRHRAEEDLAVASASILARSTYLEGLHHMSEQLGILIPKGCSSKVITIGKEIVRQFGEEKLKETCKMHFKTLDAILGKQRQ